MKKNSPFEMLMISMNSFYVPVFLLLFLCFKIQESLILGFSNSFYWEQ